MTEHRRRPRAPGMVYAALSGTMAVLLAVVAITATQPPPPTIAEFAPQAQQQIDEQNIDQDFRAGEAGTRPTPSPTPTPLVGGSETEDAPEVPRTNECNEGDPPRQIRDPQSPPCVPGWEGDNGGATSQGVTPTEIRVLWPTSIEDQEDVQLLAQFFNSRFEFYGRQINLLAYKPRGAATGPADPAQMRADADQWGTQNVFASLMYPPRDGTEYHHYDALAEHGVISVDARQSLRDSDHFQRHAPYQWAVEPPYDEMTRSFGRWYCDTLHDRTAAHAGGSLQAERRVLGVLRAPARDAQPPDDSHLLSALARCGVEPAVNRELKAQADDLADGTNAIVALEDAGVTSVVCICNAAQLEKKLMPAATTQRYEPEWLLTAFQVQDRETAASLWPQDQARRAFGIAFRNKWHRDEDMPWFWAIKETNPGWIPPPEQGYNMALVERYAELLLLSSGIQLAGPTLTPETFARGLKETRFPNPGCGGPRYHQACVGFGSGDFYFHDDATQIWWSPTEQSYTTNSRRGAFCYVDRGKRYGLSSWPKTEQAFFQGSCR